MSQLSLYDFLSFFLPGFLALEILRFAHARIPVFAASMHLHLSEVEKGILVLAASLILGLIIHRISFWAIEWEWYAKIMMPSIKKIVLDSKGIIYIRGEINAFFIDAIGKPLINEDNSITRYAFDHAYYVLEANDKITASKGFQSHYFFMRNMFLLSVLTFLGMILLQLMFYCSYNTSNPSIWTAMFMSIAGILVSIPVARFCRVKMVERIFWTYYILKKDPLKK